MRLGLSGKGAMANQLTVRRVSMHWKKLWFLMVSPIMFFQLSFVTFCGFYIHQRYIRGFREFPLKAFPDSPSRELFAATSLP